MKNIPTILILLFGLISCNNNNSSLSSPFDPGATKIIGHKGNGDIGKNGNRHFIANSIGSILKAMENTNGSELDIQISADTTIWLFHDNEIIKCNGEKENIAFLSDKEIQEISRCKYKNQLATLSDLLDKISSKSYTDKTISIDFKALMNDENIDKFRGKLNLAEVLLDELMSLPKLQDFNTLLEIPSTDLVKFFEDNTTFEVFELVYNEYNFNSINRGGYSMSVENAYKTPYLLEANSSNFQLWTANRAEEMMNALSLKPDYVQTDNIALAKFFLNTDSLQKEIVFKENNLAYNEDQEYIMIKEIPLYHEVENFMLNFNYSQVENPQSNALLVFSCKNERDEAIYWQGYPITDSNIYEFINTEFLLSEGAKSLKVYIWNNKGDKEILRNIKLGKLSYQSAKASIYNPRDPLLLGHRATGSKVKSGFLENTMPAVKEALKYADGIEVDVQMSSSNTLWMYHNSLLTNLCPESQKIADSLGMHCILSSPDHVIKQFKLCYDSLNEMIYPLKDLMKLLSEEKYENKIVSLDIKGYFDEKCLPSNNVSERYLRELNDELYSMIQEYNMENRVIIETDYVYLLELMTVTDKDIKCFLLAYNNLPSKINTAITLGLDGISFNLNDSSLNNANVEYLKSKNLKLQLWTIKTKDALEEVMRYNPYSIQISDIEILRSTQEKKTQPQH